MSGMFRLMALALLLMLAAACAQKPRGPEPLVAIDASFDNKQMGGSVDSAPPPPAEISSALLPPPRVVPTTPAAEILEPRFDISASQVPAREFFLGLVEGSKANMVVHPDVQGDITISLKNTTVSEVLEIIHNVYGYPYFRTGSVYQVMPAGMQARTYQVNYLNLVRKGLSQTRVSSGQVSDLGKDGEAQIVSGSRIDTESNADFWGELASAVQGIVGTEGGRKVVVQPQASVIVVVAMPDELQAVERYLKAIQTNLQRQVVIEAKVIEVELSDGFQSGVNWAVLAETGGKSGVAGQTGGTSLFDTGVSDLFGKNIDLDPQAVLEDGLQSSAFGGIFSLALNFNDFQAFIELLQSQGDVQVLSSPRISTVNNQKAVIKVGSDEFFVTELSGDTVTGTTSNSTVDITLTPFFSGIALDVTPQIDAAGGITLHVHPTVSEVVDQTKQIDAFGSNQSIPLAFSTVRESDSIVRAESGQLVVIGGLMQENIVEDEAGIPLLSKIPGLGALFRHSKSVARKSELVILLRPQIIQSKDDWARTIDASRKRIEKLSPQFNRNWLGGD